MFCHRLWHRCYSVNFAKFLRTPFFIEHLRWLLLPVDKRRFKSTMQTLEQCPWTLFKCLYCWLLTRHLLTRNLLANNCYGVRQSGKVNTDKSKQGTSKQNHDLKEIQTPITEYVRNINCKLYWVFFKNSNWKSCKNTRYFRPKETETYSSLFPTAAISSITHLRRRR